MAGLRQGDQIKTIFLSIPTWVPGSPQYAVTLVVTALIAVFLLGICFVLAARNPGFMRKKDVQADLPKAVSIASSNWEKLPGMPLKIFTPFTKNSGI